MKPPNPELNRSVNKWSSKVIPLIFTGLVGYATWVEVVLIAINHCIHRAGGSTGAGIAIIVIYFLLLFLIATTYFRIIQVITTDPGYVPTSESWKLSSDKTLDANAQNRENGLTPSEEKGFLDRANVQNGTLKTPPGLERFYSRDVFECEIDGLPRWCSNCKNWKPDRSHHCSEVGRCVYKMDHFCPWAGGIVSENNFKFFVQFVFYGAVYTAFVVIVAAYYLAQIHGHVRGSSVNWAVTLGIAGFFFIFSGSMTVNSLRFTCQNTTTVDSLSRSSRQFNFAVYIGDVQGNSTLLSNLSSRYSIVTYPLQNNLDHFSGAETEHQPRAFVVLPSPIGSNPYSLGSAFQNFCQIMGHKWFDWLLPLRRSPSHQQRLRFFDRDAETAVVGGTMYPLGPVLDQMKRGAGLAL